MITANLVDFLDKISRMAYCESFSIVQNPSQMAANLSLTMRQNLLNSGVIWFQLCSKKLMFYVFGVVRIY